MLDLLYHSDKASCHVVSCAMERAIWQGTEGSLQTAACEELSLANNHMIELGSRTLLSRALTEQQPELTHGLQIMRDSEAEDPVKLCLDSCSTETVR